MQPLIKPNLSNRLGKNPSILSLNATPDSTQRFLKEKHTKTIQKEFQQENIPNKKITQNQDMQQSKSTKVSPSKYLGYPQTSNAVQQSQQVLALIEQITKAQISAQSQANGKTDGSYQNHSQFNLRIPQQTFLQQQDHNLYQNKKNSQSKEAILNIGQSFGCEEFENFQDSGTSNIQQSFINLIYPSKSKKHIGNESTMEQKQQQNQYQPVADHQNDSVQNCSDNHFINKDKYKAALVSGHHQKSKSVLIGNQSDKMQFIHEQNLAQQQKAAQQNLQQQQKKQSQVFNYSKRLKQLLKNEDEQPSSNSQTQQNQNINAYYKQHQIFSQQPSPSSKGKINNLSIQPSTIDFTQQIIKPSHSMIKSTFDKEYGQSSNELMNLIDSQNVVGGQNNHISYTLDYFQNKISQQKSHTSSNTPSNTQQVKSKEIFNQQSSKTHIRKPSYPLKNAFIIEDSSPHFQDATMNYKLMEIKDSTREPSLEKELSAEILKQPYREKKQHQPTQSKILQHKQGAKTGNHHQRSQSDYQMLMQQQQMKLSKYLNSNSNAELVGVSSQLQGEEFLSQDFEKPLFMKQYSQASMDMQLGKQIGSSIKKDYSQHLTKSHIENQRQQIQQPHSSIIMNSFKGEQSQQKGSIYQQRKLSFQHISQNTAAPHSKRSPQKNYQQYVIKENTQSTTLSSNSFNSKITPKTLSRKTSPKPMTNNYVNYSIPKTQNQVMNTISNLHTVSQSKLAKSSHQSSFSQKTSVITSPVNSGFNSKKNSQIANNNKNSFSSQVTAIQQNQNTIQHQTMHQHQPSLKQAIHSSSAAILTLHHQRSKSDITSNILNQFNKKKNGAVSNSNSLTNSQKKVKPQNQAKAEGGQKVNSERISPRTQIYQNIVKNQKNITNVSIDLLSGQIITVSSKVNTNNISQTNQVSSKNSNMQRSISKPLINSSTTQNTLSLQNSVMKRKDSFHQIQAQQQPQAVSHQNSVDLRASGQNRTKESSVQKYINGYSQQNSPLKNNTQFYKGQQQAQHLKSNDQLLFSPQNKSSSFIQINKGGASTKKQNNFKVDNSSDEAFKVNYGNQGAYKLPQQQQQQPSMVNQFSKACILKGNEQQNQQKLQSFMLSESDLSQTTETEQILRQMKNNCSQKNNAPKQEALGFINYELLERQFYKKQQEDLFKKQKLQNLHKITEASDCQINDTIENNANNKPRQKSLNPLNLNNSTIESSFMYLTTDPNMSPHSKDLFKLKKLIKFNFKKYNEPPVTTSEFYRIGRILGRGAFGKVNLAAHKLSEQLVAIKSISKEYLKSEEDQKKKIMQEVGILKQSNHPSVVRLFDSFETNKHICFVMELCSGGDLLTYVRKRRKLKEDVAKYFFKQIIEGLAYIHHSKLIVHRDIKLDNILLDANGKIKICDFGVSKQVSCESEKLTEQCGTPAYIAPEILVGKGYEGFKVDVWSAGVCLYAMLIGTVPFKAASMNELHQLIINGKYEIGVEEKLSETSKDLIAKLLTVDPKKRLSACEVLNHPWLKDTLEELDIFTQKEKDVITKEYLSKNIDKISKKDNPNTTQNHDTDPIFTEHNLDTRTNNNSLLKNASTKSIILAPFNSTISDFDENDDKPHEWPDELKSMIIKKKIIKFAPKCRDLNRQYEQNNNADLDNGVYNNFANDQEDKSQESNSQNSDDSLKKSFKETELSSDDEKADLQVEEAHKKKLEQQSELLEFENQIRMKYVKYQEPIHQVDQEIVDQINLLGVYPKDYLHSAISNKDMNYCTATYNLLSKKKQLYQKLFLNEQKLLNESQLI